MIFQLLRIFMVLYTLEEVHSNCHECQTNVAACHDEMHFTMCAQGISKDELRRCPDGSVCTGRTEICSPNSVSDPVQSTCKKGCNMCNIPGKLFACLDEKTFAFCFGADTPNYSAKGTCPDGQVCNIDQMEFCTSAANVYPSCYNGIAYAPTTLSPPTTTPSTTKIPPNLDAFCNAVQEIGFHRDYNDPTCRKYILCYILSGQYLGLSYTCSDTEFYNDEAKRCEIQRPANC